MGFINLITIDDYIQESEKYIYEVYYLQQYTETMEAMSEIDEDELLTADALYYAEVTARITAKLLEVAE